jgi:hypothetical protein
MQVNLLKYTPLSEIEDMLGRELVVKQIKENLFYAGFEEVEVKAGETLVTKISNNMTADAAIRDYLDYIQGKTIVIGAYTDERKEYNIPPLISFVKLGF